MTTDFTIPITLNGQPASIESGATVAGLVEEHAPAASGIAVAVNGRVVRRSSWDDTALREGDQVEIITAFQGG